MTNTQIVDAFRTSIAPVGYNPSLPPFSAFTPSTQVDLDTDMVSANGIEVACRGISAGVVADVYKTDNAWWYVKAGGVYRA